MINKTFLKLILTIYSGSIPFIVGMASSMSFTGIMKMVVFSVAFVLTVLLTCYLSLAYMEIMNKTTDEDSNYKPSEGIVGLFEGLVILSLSYFLGSIGFVWLYVLPISPNSGIKEWFSPPSTAEDT